LFWFYYKYMFNLLSEMPLVTIIRVAAVLLAITIHEYCHGLAADKLGDPTPRINDRLSLNPIKHLDPLGTLALFFLGIGWAKPVPIDPFNFQNKKRDMALVSLAGPLSNFISALIIAFLLKFFLPILGISAGINLLIRTLSYPFIAISIGLAVFNLIPIPPLDGAKILFAILPKQLAYEWEETIGRYGLLILMFLLFPLFGRQAIIMNFISPIISTILNLLL